MFLSVYESSKVLINIFESQIGILGGVLCFLREFNVDPDGLIVIIVLVDKITDVDLDLIFVGGILFEFDSLPMFKSINELAKVTVYNIPLRWIFKELFSLKVYHKSKTVKDKILFFLLLLFIQLTDFSLFWRFSV